MEPIYDLAGKAVGWLHAHVVYDRLNRHRAFVQTDAGFSFRHLGAVFSYRGAYLGHFDPGFFRDRAGQAVAWIQGAHSGPLPPAPQMPPAPPILPAAPLPPVVPPPPAPTPSLSWSTLTWEVFLSQ